MDNRAATLLKYRFGDLAEMQHHLHVVEGRTLLFYRDARTTLLGGARVLVEFSLGNSDQVTTLRGAVLARVDTSEGAGQAGVWIEFPDARLMKRLDQGGAGIAARRQRRLGCDYLVEVKHGRIPFLGRMVDVSMGGARLLGAAGLRAGAPVELRIMGAEPPLPAHLGQAEVVRSDPSASDVGLRFMRADAVARVSAGKLFQAVQQAWTKAPELTHPSLCCQHGQMLEPPLPHMKTRT